MQAWTGEVTASVAVVLCAQYHSESRRRHIQLSTESLQQPYAWNIRYSADLLDLPFRAPKNTEKTRR